MHHLNRRLSFAVMLFLLLLAASYIPSAGRIPFLSSHKIAFAGTVPPMNLPWLVGDKDVQGNSIYLGGGPHSAPITYACAPNNAGVRPIMRMSGLDFDMAAGTNVLAVADGWVVYTGTVPGIYGDVVAIDHGDGFSTQYWHLQKIVVANNTWVAQGTVIGQSGSPPGGAHLHLEMRYYRNPSLPAYTEASPLIGDNSVGLPYPAHGISLSANIQNGQYTNYTVRAETLQGTKNGLNYNGSMTIGSDGPYAGLDCHDTKKVAYWRGSGGTLVASVNETQSNTVTGSTNTIPAPPQVLVQDAWTTNANGMRTTSYAPNQYIGFSTTINNTSGSSASCTLIGEAIGARQIMYQTQSVSLPSGISQQSLPGVFIPSDSWNGQYFFRLRAVCSSSTTSGLASSFTISAVAPSTYIVLTWPSFRIDMDSHLWLPVATPAHIWYQNLGNLNASPNAALDKDDTYVSGMETIAISQLLPGTYYYAVYNFGNSGTISGSYIGVRLYQNGVITRELQAPTTGKSNRWWDVFRLIVSNGGSVTVTVVNKIVSNCPGPYDCPTDSQTKVKG